MMLWVMAAVAAPPVSAPATAQVDEAVPASPAVAADLARLAEAIPEILPLDGARGGLALPRAAADWLGRLGDAQQRQIALVILLSYGLPPEQETGADLARGMAFLAAETARSSQNPAHARRNVGPPQAERSARAARALAWGARLGICDAAFVETLRSLPPPGANGEPDLRPVVRDLGMPAYTQGRCTNDVSNGTPVK